MKIFVAGSLLALSAFVAAPSHEVAEEVALRGRSQRQHTHSARYWRGHSSPGYEYRYHRAEARTAAGYTRLFGI